ncbi:MAG: T9SS type A sorting domain-containing protein, partial [Candidatus Zixiibacteriota bacterium]
VPFNPYQSRSAHLNQNIPNNAPISDEYIYYGYVGDYPAVVIDSSYFPFEVIAGELAKAGEGGWFLTGSFLEGDDLVGLPTEFALLSNYPNPFNASTVIEYQLPVTTDVKLEVYNLIGEKVVTLVNGAEEAGYKSVIWDASSVSSGLYFYRLTCGDFSEAKMMMLVK